MPATRMAKLGIFIGTWNTNGEVLATDTEPAQIMTATDTYRWLPGNQFIVHEADARLGAIPTRSTEVMGFDPSKRHYFATSYDDRGLKEEFVVALNGRHWSIVGTKVRFKGNFNRQKNRLAGLWEMKGKTSEWQPYIKLELVRA